ncbi:hypothetical protein [Nocardia rhizosphaerae]|uniref:Uncharacterized protein n=1 Tax=Nocardia rhizosphaerae TaxID=1691571 RepID=A0ABV8L252_9NOCA
MSTPTPDEITAALATLRRIPDIDDQATLGAIERSNYPLRWMARDLHAQLAVDFPEHPGTLAIALSASAARHGLRITTDPGQPGDPVGYITLVPRDGHFGRGWRQSSDYMWRADNLDEAVSHARDTGESVAAVYLLPEGSQA